MAKMVDNEMSINKKTRADYFDRLKLLATSIFTWDGLDEIGGNSRFLENTLFEEGRACFVKDPELGYLSIHVNPSDKLNVYNLPTKVNAWSLGYSKMYDFDDIVYIMNNEMQLPTRNTIDLMSYRLYETERTIDTNLTAMKTPIVFEGSKDSILSLKNAWAQFNGNMPVMFTNNDFDLGKKMNAINTNAPYLIDKLEIHKHSIWNECLSYLGIDNANTDKKERLITDEVESNNELINYYLNCFYKTRKKACDEINEKFFNGKEQVSIKLNKDLIELLNETAGFVLNETEAMEEGESNE